MNYRKERFLIHPIFEIFLKLKWYQTWGVYMVIVAMYSLFMVAIGGFSLAHFGKFFAGQEKYEYQVIENTTRDNISFYIKQLKQ